MYQIKPATLKTILTSKYWLIISLSGAFLSFFALNRGGVVVFIDACFVFLIINIFSGTYKIRAIPIAYLIASGVCIYLLVNSLLFYPKASHYRWIIYMARMLVIVFAIHYVSIKKLEGWVILLSMLMLSATVIWQFVAIHFYNKVWGTFSNPHYLASVMVLVLPIFIFYFLTARGYRRFLFIPVALLDIHLLLKLVIESRPSFLGLVIGTLFVLFFLTSGKTRWGSLLLTGAALSGLLITNYASVYSRFKDLLVNFSKDERILIWRDTWNLLLDNTFAEWIIGNGIGVFRTVYPEYHARAYDNLIFPHFFPLEILYDSGLIALILVVASVTALMITAMKTGIQSTAKNHRKFIKCMIVIFLTWLIHCGLSLPLFSKYSQYSLAFVLGALLAGLTHSESTMLSDKSSTVKAEK